MFYNRGMRYRCRSALLLIIFAMASVLSGGGVGSQTVTTSGAPVQLLVTNPPTKAVGCTVTAQSGNSGTVYLGFSSAVSAATKVGTPLPAGASYTCMPAGNTAIFPLGTIWLDSTASGDKVSYSWF